VTPSARTTSTFTCTNQWCWSQPHCTHEIGAKSLASIASMDILDRAFRERYGVAAFNVVNDLTLEAVVAAAAELSSPVIVQTSVKTVRSIGSKLLFAMWREITAGVDVPVSLHLDHCPDRSVITECLKRGWNSVLFDGSRLPVEENLRQTAESSSRRATTEPRRGEIEPITGSRTVSARRGHRPGVLDVASGSSGHRDRRLAPAIGNAHGMYKQTPTSTCSASPTSSRSSRYLSPCTVARA